MGTVIPQKYRDEIRTCFLECSPVIYRFLLGYTSYERELAEDLVQETFLRAANNWAEIRNLERERHLGWLRQVATNAAVDCFRRNDISRKDRLPVAWIQLRDADPHRDALTAIAMRCLDETIKEMPQRRRLIAFLKWRCGWNNGEIANELLITPGAVSQSLAKARETLMQELKNFVPFEMEQGSDRGGG